VYKARTHPPRSLQSVWRYFTASRLIEFLSTGNLYFAHLPTLSDGLEGAFTERTRQRVFDRIYAQCRDAASAHEGVREHERRREEFYVNCWHMNETESYLMWKVYGDRGFAVATTVERLAGAFESTTEEIEGTVVNYVDHSREEIPSHNIYPVVETKDIPYRDEREFRLLIWKPRQDNRPQNPEGKGIPVPVDVGLVVRSIYVSPQLAATAAARDELSALVREKGLDCDILSSAVVERRRSTTP
jgi:hypothetical protein